MTLHILHTNDFHSRLNETGAARLRQAVAQLGGEPYLLLDAGDAVKAGNISVSPFGEPVLDTMSDLGYHAMAMGNREFHVWKTALKTKIAQAKFPVLCANVRARDMGTLPVLPSVRVTVGGLRIALFGLTVPMVTARMKVASLSSLLFDDPITTAKAQVAELRWDADVLIALTHIGLTQDKRLAENVRGIDLIIGGHSHNALGSPENIQGTPIVQTGSHARHYGHVLLRIDGSGVAIERAGLTPLQEAVK